MKKILILREKFSHMGPHSGYDTLFDFNGLGREFRIRSLYLSQNKRPLWFKALQKLGFKKEMNNYTFNQYKLGIKTWFYTFFYHPRIIHFTFLEENLLFLKWMSLSARLKKRSKMLGTSHQPPAWWNQKRDISLLGQMDGLVILNKNLSDYFSQKIPAVPLFEVPHPVDTRFFRKLPGQRITSRNCLFIGYWLRDFDCLFETIHTAARRHLPLHFDLVIPLHGISRMQTALGRLPKGYITIHTGIPDEALLQLLNNAVCLFLPLKDFTANNSLLEALACELPVVIAAVNTASIYYQTASVRVFPPGEIDNILNCITAMTTDETGRANLGRQARRFAEEQFSLPVTQNKILDVYRTLS